MIRKFEVTSDLYSQPDAKGKQKLIKKGIITRLLVNTHDIKYVEEAFDTKGRIIPGVCDVIIDQNYKRLNHSFDEICDLVLPPLSKTGFKQ